MVIRIVTLAAKELERDTEFIFIIGVKFVYRALVIKKSKNKEAIKCRTITGFKNMFIVSKINNIKLGGKKTQHFGFRALERVILDILSKTSLSR